MVKKEQHNTKTMKTAYSQGSGRNVVVEKAFRRIVEENYYEIK